MTSTAMGMTELLQEAAMEVSEELTHVHAHAHTHICSEKIFEEPLRSNVMSWWWFSFRNIMMSAEQGEDTRPRLRNLKTTDQFGINIIINVATIY